MPEFYQFLADHHIEYERHDHPAVYTVEEAERLVPPLPGAKSKNLFLRDKKGLHHFLVNTSTLVISRKNLQRFIEATGHQIQIVDVPGQDKDDRTLPSFILDNLDI